MVSRAEHAARDQRRRSGVGSRRDSKSAAVAVSQRGGTIMLCKASLTIAVLLVAGAPARAQMPPQPPPPALPFQIPSNAGTTQERDACHPDVMKFCKDAVPDQFRILNCLQTNRSRISNGCRGVLSSHGV